MLKELCNRDKDADITRNAESRKTATDDQRQREKQLLSQWTERRRRLFDENIDIKKGDGRYWDFVSMNVEIFKGAALRYMAERVKLISRDSPRFPNCYNNEKVQTPPKPDPPIYLRKLLANTGSQSRHLRKVFEIINMQFQWHP